MLRWPAYYAGFDTYIDILRSVHHVVLSRTNAMLPLTSAAEEAELCSCDGSDCVSMQLMHDWRVRFTTGCSAFAIAAACSLGAHSRDGSRVENTRSSEFHRSSLRLRVWNFDCRAGHFSFRPATVAMC